MRSEERVHWRQIVGFVLVCVLVLNVCPVSIFAQPQSIDSKVAETEQTIGKIASTGKRFEPSADLMQYAQNKIDVNNPTKILDYSSTTSNHLPSDQEAKEYFIKAASEGQPGIVLFGSKDFAKNAIEDIIYNASYGIYLKHLSNWKIESELIDPAHDIYRHLVSFEYAVPKNHTEEMEDRVDQIAAWVTEQTKNVQIPDEMIKQNHLDAKGVEDLKKAMLIHDYVIKNVKPYYGNKAYLGEDKYERHAMSTAVFEGESVCQGFFLFYSRIANRVGLDTRMVRGYKGLSYVYNNDASKQEYIDNMNAAVATAKKGGRWGMDTSEYGANHGWNQIKIGDKWYNADISGDSSETHIHYENSWPTPQHFCYKYFLRTDEEMKKPVTVPASDDEGNFLVGKQFLVWDQNENYDTATEPFKWTYDVMYAFDFNGGVNSDPYLQRSFENNYPLGRIYDDKGKLNFEKKDLKYVPQTRYEVVTPAYQEGADPIKVRKGIKTPEEALRSAGVCGVMLQDGSRNAKGFVNFATVKSIAVSHDDKKQAAEFEKIKDTEGAKITLTAFFEVDGKRYAKDVALEIAPNSEFQSTLAMQLKDGSDSLITLPQQVVNNVPSENKLLRTAKIAEIDKEIMARTEVMQDGKGVPLTEFKGEKKIIWQDSKYNDDNAPIDKPTKDNNYLVRTVLAKGDDGKWSSLEFKINFTEVEKTTTTKLECDTYYIEKDADDKVGLMARKYNRLTKQMEDTNNEIPDGGNFEKFFQYRGHPITREWKNSLGITNTRFDEANIYLLDDEDNPKYKTTKLYEGKLLKKDAKGAWTVPVPESEAPNTLNKMFVTPGTYVFSFEVRNGEDGVLVKRKFTVKVLTKEESEQNKWDAEAKPVSLKTSQTVTYTGADSKTPAANIQETFSFTGKRHEGTGKTIWNEQSYTYNDVPTPVVEGYIADKAYVPGAQVTPDKPTATAEVSYKKVGRIVPVDTEGKPLLGVEPKPYENDQNDPTKVLADMSVPEVPGYKPEFSQVTPQDPAKDTQVVYTAIKPIDYKMIKAPTSITIDGTDVLFISEAPYDKFKEVRMDNEVVDPANYTSKSGSTEVTIKGAYLKTLGAGSHTLSIVSADGAATVSFVVAATSQDPNTPRVPDTPNNSNNNSTAPGTHTNKTPGTSNNAQADVLSKILPKMGDGTVGSASILFVSAVLVIIAWVLKDKHDQRRVQLALERYKSIVDL
ncbi:mucin-binding protein [Atopobium fossor]|uniref:mucin-binding protein n=1 Tax=Atopobium fossor TaxID=39487 RepID=UPI0004007231|nr:transglutaminase domain-containing protein [Atopobium fossor]